MRRRTKARECALKILYAMDIRKDDADVCLDDYWISQGVANVEVKAFTHLLVTGVADKRAVIDEILNRYAENWELNRMAAIDRNVLRLGAFELLFAEDIPAKVALNEAVDLAKRFGNKESGKFVNGILDKVHKKEKRGSGE